MPFSSTSEKHSEAYWTDFFEKFIKPTVEKFGYSCKRSCAQPSNIVKDILTELLNADLVVAVLTDFNANVWYELGIRHSLRQGTIMIIEDGIKVPFDISTYGVIKYRDSISNVPDFEKQFESFLSKIEKHEAIDSPVIEFIGSRKHQDLQKMEEILKNNYEKKLDKLFELIKNMQGTTRESVNSGKRKKSVKHRILWVDDYPINNEALIDLYRVKGVEFDLAINTAQALEALGKKEYDLIISDISRGAEGDAGVRMLWQMRLTFGYLPPVLFFSTPNAIGKYGKAVEKEGATLVTSSTLELTNIMNQILEL